MAEEYRLSLLIDFIALYTFYLLDDHKPETSNLVINRICKLNFIAR